MVVGSWYAREVQRCAIDHWQHLGSSLRRTAEVMRSWLGRPFLGRAVVALAVIGGVFRPAGAEGWVWRDFRLRLSRGRNHCTDERLERAALHWAIYRNFTPAQWRSERKRRYRWPGRSRLEVAGFSPGKTSYLDALSV